MSICCLMILGRALMVTGALEPLARLLARLWVFNRHVALLALLASAMALSAFINDTPVVVVLMPVVIGLSPQAILAAVMVFLGILTNFVSNNAAAAVGTPVALSIAQQIGAPLEPFVLAAIVGCNLSFATPMGYQTNVLIMQPGGYVFRDFVRVGGPLVVLMIVAFSLELASSYPM